MLPSRQLNELATRKASQRQAITRHRLALGVDCNAAVQPLWWIDRLRGNLWQIPLFAPVAYVALRYITHRISVNQIGLTVWLRRWNQIARLGARGMEILGILAQRAKMGQM